MESRNSTSVVMGEYVKAAWTDIVPDPLTGRLISYTTEPEESIRTLSNIRLDTEGWGNNYIKAYCHKRDAERVFRFDRIKEIEILDL